MSSDEESLPVLTEKYQGDGSEELNDRFKAYSFSLEDDLPVKFYYLGGGSVLESIRDSMSDKKSLREEIEEALDQELSVNDVIMVAIKATEDATPEEISNVLSVSNSIYKETGSTRRFKDIKSARKTFREWSSRYRIRKMLDYSANAYTSLEKMIENYNRNPNVITVSKPVTNKMTVKYDILKDGKKLDEVSGMDIFAGSRCTEKVPFIYYMSNENGKRYYRIHSSAMTKDLYNNIDVMIPKALSKDPDKMYISFWAGKSTKMVKGLYSRCEIDFRTSIAKIIAKVFGGSTNKEIIDLISKQTSTEHGNIEEGTTDGSIEINGVERFNESILLDIIAMRPFSSILFIDEFNVRHSERKSMILKYTDPIYEDPDKMKSSYPQNKFISKMNISEETYTKRTKVNGKVYVPGDKYIHVSISKAKDSDTFRETVALVKILFAYYIKKSKRLFKLYKLVIPGFGKVKKSKKEAKRKERKLDVIKSKAPEIFVSGWSTTCGSERQPKVMNEEEFKSLDPVATRWKGIYNISKKRGRPKYVMEFPKEDPTIYLSCESSVYKYPGVSRNENLSNKEEYPYLPCCFQKNQMTQNKSKYSEYYQGQKSEKVTKSVHIGKILGRGINAQLHPDMLEILKSVKLTSKRYKGRQIDFDREGTIKAEANDLSSFIDALGKYKHYDDVIEDLKERAYMAKQELYNMSLKEIKKGIGESIDGADLYHILEELFSYKIFIFEMGTSKGIRGIRPLYPKSYGFHVSPYKDVKCKILLRNWGSRSAPEYPQYEIVRIKIGSSWKKTFPIQYTKAMYLIFNQSKMTITTTYEQNMIKSFKNFYSSIDYLRLVQPDEDEEIEPNYQIIDNRGKMRAIIYEELDGFENGLTLVVPPSQPIYADVVEQDYDYPRCKLKEILRVMKKPSGYDIYKGKAIGVWYKALYRDYSLYIPIIATKIEEPYNKGPMSPIYQSGESDVLRITKLREKLSIIMQLIQWCFYVYKMEEDGSAEDFIDMFKITNKDIDSLSFYESGTITRRLPQVDTLAEAMAFSKEMIPTLIKKRRFIMYDKKMKDSVVYFINRIDEYKTVEIPTYIKGLYDSPLRFEKNKDSLVVIGRDNLNRITQNILSSTFDVYTKLDPSLMDKISPYIYVENGFPYIIQNVVLPTTVDSEGKATNIYEALNVCDNWYKNGYNPGFYSDPITIKVNYATMAMSSGSLVEIERNFDDEDDYYMVLLYGRIDRNIRERVVITRDDISTAEYSVYAAILRL